MIQKLFLIFLLSLAFNFSEASVSCTALFSTSSEVFKVLSSTEDWFHFIKPLEQATDPRLKNSFTLRSSSGKVPFLAPAYQNAKFIRAHQPRKPLQKGLKEIRSVEFGYNLKNEFRRIGPLNYILLDASGNVVEVGGGSKVLLDEFKAHLHGRTWTRRDEQIVNKINRELFEDLRRNPEVKRKIKEFAKKRKWPEGLEDQAQLVYFDPRILSLEDWAVRRGYTLLQMRDAGWFSLVFDSRGNPSVRPTSGDSIKIPFFKDGEISLWRTRKLSVKDNGPKYLSWPLNRSIEREFGVDETLYNGWKLPQARGKKIVITEGEFKCLVAERATGIVTVGIPGISQFYGPMVKALVEAQAEEYIVILDRDPKAKALMHADGITDSERAAYTIARELQRSGARSVRVGRLPDAFEGSKVGIDDLILEKGVQPYLETIDTAVSPENYAKQIGLDPVFQEILIRRGKLSKALREYRLSVASGGSQAPLVPLESAQSTLGQLNLAFEKYLKDNFKGRRLDQPSAAHASILRLNRPSEISSLDLRLADGQKVSPRSFENDLLVFEYVPSDVSPKSCRPFSCETIPYTQAEIQAQGGKNLVTKHLTRDFPLDEYKIEFGVRIGPQDSFTGKALQNGWPAVIFKKSSGDAVAVIGLHESDSQASSLRGIFQKIFSSLRPSFAHP